MPDENQQSQSMKTKSKETAKRKQEGQTRKLALASCSAFSDLANLWIWSYEKELTENAMWAVTKFAKMCDGSIMSKRAYNWLKDGRSAKKNRELLYGKPNAGRVACNRNSKAGFAEATG